MHLDIVHTLVHSKCYGPQKASNLQCIHQTLLSIIYSPYNVLNYWCLVCNLVLNNYHKHTDMYILLLLHWTSTTMHMSPASLAATLYHARHISGPSHSQCQNRASAISITIFFLLFFISSCSSCTTYYLYSLEQANNLFYNSGLCNTMCK